MLEDLIKDEQEAIEKYKLAIEKCEDAKAIETFKSILEEEEKHLMMLTNLQEVKQEFDSDNDFENWDK